MKIIEYQYSNGKTCEHTRYIKEKNILKESENADFVDVFEKNTKYEKVAFGTLEPVTRRKFIKTIYLKK